ncbi:MAG: DUF996 domain-containing protein [Nitrososphaeria archaeon]
MSSRFESSKTLAGVGAILLTISSAVPVVGILGIILLLIGLRGLAEHFQEGSIFVNAFYGFIFGILGISLATLMTYSMFFAFIGTMVASPERLSAEFFDTIFDIILVVVIMFIFFFLEAIFFKRAFDLLAAKTRTRIFRTAGWILVIGAVLTIVIFGLLVLLFAWLVASIGFFSMESIQQTPKSL